MSEAPPPRATCPHDRDELMPDAALNPILNDPFSAPKRHWRLDTNNRAMDTVEQGRRSSLLFLPVPEEQQGNEPAQAQIFSADQINQTVDRIRQFVERWRALNYDGATEVSRQLLEYWTDDDRQGIRLFFAQVEALETLIYLTEVAPNARESRGLLADIKQASRDHNDDIVRLAVKMATGSGKTAVMGMTIAWHTINAINAGGLKPADRARYQTSFLVMAPGLTVKERLAVLHPSAPGNVYDDMNLVPRHLRSALNGAEVVVHNFHRFQPHDRLAGFTGTTKKLVRDGTRMTEGEETAEAMLRRVLLGMRGLAAGERVCVINDEAHHCYLPDANTARRPNKDEKENDQQAALWFSAIRALRDIEHLGAVYDYSATPLFIATASRKDSTMFPWVVSDYPLTDAIEAGLVKIPRFPVADDSADGAEGAPAGAPGSEPNTEADTLLPAELERRPVVWRNLYEHVERKKLSRTDMPWLLRDAVGAVYRDYTKVHDDWEQKGVRTPPVMIFVANDIANAEEIYSWLSGDHSGDDPTEWLPAHCDLFSNKAAWDALRDYQQGEHDDEAEGAETSENSVKPPPIVARTLLVHSRLENEDSGSGKLKSLLETQAQLLKPGSAKNEAAHIMREALNSVGDPNGLGANVRCVVSVSMLTEGWDTKTVTHVVGFRAFSTQLLCEQVTGRALRRTTYDSFDESGCLTPQFAEVIGIPFDFTTHIGGDGGEIEPLITHTVRSLEHRRLTKVIKFPMVVGYRSELPSLRVRCDESMFAPFEPSVPRPTKAQLHGVAGEATVIGTEQRLAARQGEVAAALTAELVKRIERNWLETANAPDAEGRERVVLRRVDLFRQLRPVVLTWLTHPNVGITPDLYGWLVDDQVLDQAASELSNAVVEQPTTAEAARHRFAVYDETLPFDTTDDVLFETAKPLRWPGEDEVTTNSHLNIAVCDSRLEQEIAAELDANRAVDAWVRNYRLDWTIPWFNDAKGRWANYVPDFVARVGGGPDDHHAVHLIVEGKGQPDDASEAKKRFATEWWISGVRNSAETPDELRHWMFFEVPGDGLATLREAIKQATSASARLRQSANQDDSTYQDQSTTE